MTLLSDSELKDSVEQLYDSFDNGYEKEKMNNEYPTRN